MKIIPVRRKTSFSNDHANCVNLDYFAVLF